MHISINVNNASVADQILAYLKAFKQEEVVVETVEDADLEMYMCSKQFQKDKNHLHKTLLEVTSGKSKISCVDADFWSEMDKVIESA